MDVTSNLKYAADICYSVPASIGLHKHSITIITTSVSGVDKFGDGGSKSRVETRITLTGQNVPLQFDGYLNPMFEQTNAQDIFLSGGLITDKMFRVGPIVFPYTYGTYTGGTAVALTNPAASTSNVQLLFKVIGPSFPDGALLKRKWSREDSGISYFLYLENAGLLDV